MWLAANQKPDFRTINAFRGERLKSVIEEVFTATVKLLYEKGYVKLEKYFVDGTKIESAANITNCMYAIAYQFIILQN